MNLKLPSKISNAISNELQIKILEKAKSILRKKNTYFKENSLNLDSASIIKNPITKDEYLIFRYHIKKEYQELYYLHIAVRLIKDKIEFIQEEDGILNNEMSSYGGKFHFQSAFYIEQVGLILIYIHYGFDSAIRTIYLIDKNKFIELAAGGGDAC